MAYIWTLKKIADSILKNVTGAIGNINYSISKEQLKYAINARRASILKEISLSKSEQVLLAKLYQTIPCIELDCENLERCCEVQGFESALHFRIPRLAMLDEPVIYLGLPNKMKPFKVYLDNTFAYHQYTLRTAHRPYSWIDTSILATKKIDFNNLLNSEFETSNIFLDGYIFNPPTENFKYLSITAIFDNPMDINTFNCTPLCDDDTYPAPEFIIDKIVTSVTNEYIQMYRKANLPNVLQNNNQGNLTV